MEKHVVPNRKKVLILLLHVLDYPFCTCNVRKRKPTSLLILNSQHSRGNSAFVISDLWLVSIFSKEHFHLVIDDKYCSLSLLTFSMFYFPYSCLIQPHFLYIMGWHSKLFYLCGALCKQCAEVCVHFSLPLILRFLGNWLCMELNLALRNRGPAFETDWPKFMETIIVMFLVVSTV